MHVTRRTLGKAALVVLLAKSALAGSGPSFATGEATTVAIRFLGLEVAQAVARLIADSPVNGRPTMRLLVEAHTGRIASLFYPVHNAYDIHLDTETLRPLTVTKRIDEREFSTTLRAVYPPPGAPEGPVYDFFSALLTLRRWAESLDDTLALVLDADGDRWRALARRGPVDTLQTPRGREPAQLIRVTFERLSPEPRRKRDFPDILSRELVSERGGLKLWFPCASPELLLRGELTRPGLKASGEWTGD